MEGESQVKAWLGELGDGVEDPDCPGGVVEADPVYYVALAPGWLLLLVCILYLVVWRERDGVP